MGRHSDEYVQYLRSAKWRAFRERVIRYRGNHCEACAADGKHQILQVHHRTYQRLGQERLVDVELLCIECHALADTARRQTIVYKGKRVHNTKVKRRRRRR